VFARAVELIAEFLGSLKDDGTLAGHCVIGGLALAALGRPRATRDIDFLIALGPGGAEPVARRARDAGFECRYLPGGADDPLRGVFQLSVPVAGANVPVQLVVLPTPLSSALLREAQPLSLFGTPLPVVSWAYLVLLKLYAGGPQDLLDAREILTARRPSGAELADLGSLAERFGLEGEMARLIREASGEGLRDSG
jgi:hypothetical protein